MQLVTDRILFYDFESGIKGRSGHRPERKLDIDGVIDYFGVPPEKVIDVQALVGDTSDNVPGVPGIGIKTASALIKEYGDLETLLARAEEIKQPKRRETLIEFADQARMSKRLVTLDRHVDCETPLSATRVGDFDAGKLIAFGKALELTTLVKRVAEASGIDPNSVDADPRLKSDKLHARHLGGEADAAEAKIPAPAAGRAMPEPGEGTGRGPGGLLAGDGRGKRRTAPSPRPTRATRRRRGGDRRADRPQGATRPSPTAPASRRWIAEAMEAGHVAIDVADAPRRTRCWPRSSASRWRPGRAAPPMSRSATATARPTCSTPACCPARCRSARRSPRLKPLLEDASVLKLAHNLKPLRLFFDRHGIAVAPYDDTILLSYALDAGKGGIGLADLVGALARPRPARPCKDVTGTGRAAIAFAAVPIDRATEYAAEEADLALRLWTSLKPRLVAEHMTNLYETLERPLVPVLARMEARGIKVDRQTLSRLSGEFAQKIGGLEHEHLPSSPARTSTSARRSSSATSCSASSACPAARRPRPARGRPAPTCSTSWPPAASTSPPASSTGASSPS